MSDFENRIDELFEQALDLPPDDRDALFARQADDVVVEAVRRLIARDEQVPDHFLAGAVPRVVPGG